MKVLLALGAFIASTSTIAGSVAWPDLPQSCFVKGRPATEEDVKRGCATFVIKSGGQATGIPLKIVIPQYAMHVDEKSGKETPVIVIQAEEKSGIKAVGYKEIGSHVFGAALLREMKFLGNKRPS